MFYVHPYLPKPRGGSMSRGTKTTSLTYDPERQPCARQWQRWMCVSTTCSHSHCVSGCSLQRLSSAHLPLQNLGWIRRSHFWWATLISLTTLNLVQMQYSLNPGWQSGSLIDTDRTGELDAAQMSHSPCSKSSKSCSRRHGPQFSLRGRNLPLLMFLEPNIKLCLHIVFFALHQCITTMMFKNRLLLWYQCCRRFLDDTSYPKKICNHANGKNTVAVSLAVARVNLNILIALGQLISPQAPRNYEE